MRSRKAPLSAGPTHLPPHFQEENMLAVLLDWMVEWRAVVYVVVEVVA